MSDSNFYILNDTAKNDSIIQMALQEYTQRLQHEYQQHEAIRAGLITPQPTTNWNISDHD